MLGGGREREILRQMPSHAWRPVQGSFPGPRDHVLSWNQESDTTDVATQVPLRLFNVTPWEKNSGVQCIHLPL